MTGEKMKINGDTEIYSDGVYEAFVYTGYINGLKEADLDWHEDDQGNKYLTLDEIADQLKNEWLIITVFVDRPLNGVIYQYGNYGDYWVKYGETIGYA